MIKNVNALDEMPTRRMSRREFEKFAVGFPYPTDWVEIVIRECDFDLEKAKEILSSKSKTMNAIEGTTEMDDGITLCCGFDFGEIAFSKKPPKYCPMCGKKICLVR